MTAFTQRWIRHELETRPFSNRIDVVWFAIKRSAWTTVVAVALNFFVYQVVGRLGLSGAVMPPDVLVDTVVTTCVAGSISLMCFYIVGMAIRDIAISRDEFERLSRTDPLTGLMNRRAFFDQANSTGRDYVLVLLDIDRFKAINDTYGHARGDEVLVALAEMLGRHLGRHAVARIGGEE
uniref:GGDEF domain-containing protein n=1 Tax=uncultured Rhizobium sp. TaxID=155567 RepID=UPI00260847C4